MADSEPVSVETLKMIADAFNIVEACDGLAEVLTGVDLEAYRARRSVRTSVEREFTIIGEAVAVLSRPDPALAARISHARLIVGFRNRLVHEYPQIDDEAVYAIARRDAPTLRAECAALLERVGDSD